MKKNSVRLSPHVRPSKYVISIKPDLDNFTFTGSEEIHVSLARGTKSVTLHSAELEILSATYRTGKKTFEGRASYKDREETATLSFETALPKGRGIMELRFAGILNDKMRGFYRSRYQHEGKDVHMAVTQFESTDARRAFPCFDEPAHKAIFEVSLIVPKDRTAISNMLETSILEHDGEYKVVKFAPSPKMSSYLLAFIVGHFEHIQKKTTSGILVRVFTTPGKKHQAAFALDCATKCIEFYEKYFGIKYPLPVMDLIAIPDFAAGAMENWGAVTYRETAVLVDPEHSSIQNRQRVALVIAHELAHQWFGNLVTMEWWTHLWLNEGFATYMEYVAINAVYPKWNIWAHFVSSEQTRALALDALLNTHAIEIDVHHPSEISEIFDAVSYSKGASVIRMLADYLGETTFRKGLRAYLKKHSYGNALTDDLWKSLERASKKPVGKIMQNWTRKPGYPMILASEAHGTLTLLQGRFFPNRNPANRDTTTWFIPLTIQEGDRGRKRILLKKKKMSFRVKSGAYLKVNQNETSFIRVKYSAANLQLLGSELESKKPTLSESDRFGIVRDAFALAKSGVSATDEALRLAKSYANETSYIVWSEIAAQLLTLRSLLFNTPLFESYSAYARSVLIRAVERIGWHKKKGESDDDAFLRATLIHTAGTFGDVKVVEKAKELFNKEIRGRGKVHADIRGAVVSLVAQNGGPKEFAALMDIYKESALEEEKDRILRALCSFKDEKILSRMLDIAFSKDARGQDTLKAVNFVWMNPYGRAIAWNYVKENWALITERFGGGHLFSRFLIPAAHFTTIDEANDVVNFFKTHPSEGINRTVAQSVEQIRSHAAWLARDEKKIADFLKRR